MLKERGKGKEVRLRAMWRCQKPISELQATNARPSIFQDAAK